MNKGTIRNFQVVENANKPEYVTFSDININKPPENIISINETEYCYTYLSNNGYNKGGNSIILKLFEAQNIDSEDLNYDIPDLILKILKFPKEHYPRKIEKRFNEEIKALKKCNQSNHQNVMKLFHSGICSIYHHRKKKYLDYWFYTMEAAEFDLKQYIEANHPTLTIDSKLNLCISLSKGLKELYEKGYYHRDLKPDNIFMVGENWKIGDLGLIDHRHENFSLDQVSEFIGPKGWISPEAMNKYLCEGKGFEHSFDCSIDHQSDIFQLGRIFWYIFQFNAPIGTVRLNDFIYKNIISDIFPIIKTMLNHSKSKRFKDISEILNLLKSIQEKYLLEL